MCVCVCATTNPKFTLPFLFNEQLAETDHGFYDKQVLCHMQQHDINDCLIYKFNFNASYMYIYFTKTTCNFTLVLIGSQVSTKDILLTKIIENMGVFFIIFFHFFILFILFLLVS